MSDMAGIMSQLVSEVAGVDHSDAVKVTDWAHVDWVRPTVEDPGSKFYGTIHVPEGFGKPGAARCLQASSARMHPLCVVLHMHMHA